MSEPDVIHSGPGLIDKIMYAMLSDTAERAVFLVLVLLAVWFLAGWGRDETDD